MILSAHHSDTYTHVYTPHLWKITYYDFKPLDKIMELKLFVCVCVNVLKEDRISFYFKCFVIVVVVVVVVSKNQGTLKMVFKVHSISLPPPTKIMTSMCIPKKILTELKKNSVCVCVEKVSK